MKLTAVVPAELPGPDSGTAPDDAALVDAALVESSRRGDPGAFDRIVSLYHGRIYQYLFQMTKHRHDAEDLTQQTFLKAYQHLGSFQTGRPLINWLLTIARNNGANHFRSARSFEQLPEQLHAAGLSPDSSAEEQDQTESLWDRVRRLLPHRQFEVLWLRFAGERSVKETAQILDLTQTHVKILAFRARQTLLKSNLRL